MLELGSGFASPVPAGQHPWGLQTPLQGAPGVFSLPQQAASRSQWAQQCPTCLCHPREVSVQPPRPREEHLNTAAANYSTTKFSHGGCQAICLAHSPSLPPASSQMAEAPTAPKPAAKHTVFPQMAFRCNYVLSIQNLQCAECESQLNINGILISK